MPTMRTMPDVDQTLERLTALLPRYSVITHNDDINTFDHVIRTFCQVLPGMTVERATELAWTIHTQGKAVVFVCPREAAEHYQERLTSHGLTVTIQPA